MYQIAEIRAKYRHLREEFPVNNYADQISQLYNIVALKRVCERDLNGPEWAEYVRTQDRWDEARDQELADFNDHYDLRIAAEKKRLIDKAGEKNLDHPAPVGVDRFNPNMIARRAQTNVQNDHQDTVDGFEANRLNELQALYDGSAFRQEQKGVARDDFTQSAEPERMPHRTPQM